MTIMSVSSLPVKVRFRIKRGDQNQENLNFIFFRDLFMKPESWENNPLIIYDLLFKNSAFLVYVLTGGFKHYFMILILMQNRKLCMLATASVDDDEDDALVCYCWMAILCIICVEMVQGWYFRIFLVNPWSWQISVCIAHLYFT